MKRFLTLLAVLASTAAMVEAQSLSFCYENGTEIPSGSTLTFHNLDPEYYEILVMPQINSGIYIKNSNESSVTANMVCNVTEMTGGELTCCLGTQCRIYQEIGTYNINNVTIIGGSTSNAQLHASSGEIGEYFSISTTLTLKEGFSECSTITVNFVYDAESPVASLDATKAEAKAVKYYDLLGRETTELKGVLIEKMSDGRCRKVRFN